MDMVTPAGFRDVLAQEAAERERISAAVRDLFSSRGYAPIETPTLEVMDVMRAGGHMTGVPFKFFDSQGDLLAMRPDVTLQVARMCATRLAGQPGPFRFRYQQRVFREAEGQMRAAAREVTQIGVECIGPSGAEGDAEVLQLFCEALETAGVDDFTISVATVGVLRALLAASGASSAWSNAVLDAFHSSNFVELDLLTGAGCPVPPVFAQALRALPRIRGGREAIDEARALVAPLGCEDGLDDLEGMCDLLDAAGVGARVRIDFSVMSSFDYYTGIVFEAYAPGLGSPLGSGGRYDNMVGVYGEDRPAAGFAFFLEQVMAAGSRSGVGPAVGAAEDSATHRSAAQDPADPSCAPLLQSDEFKDDAQTVAPSSAAPTADAREGSGPGDLLEDGAPSGGTVSPVEDGEARPLRIAVPKGALNPGTIEVLAAAGLDVTGLDDPGRQLIISNPGVDYVIVRPTDAPVFVELGAADCGICGKDSLLEADAEVMELVDLGFGGCRFVVAEPAGAREAVEERYRRLGSIRVATKYPRIAAAHYAKRGMQVEIVKLHGNIELAPLTGMAERIVDITATGTTLRENNLVVVEDVLPSTARFFANACSFRTDSRIAELARALSACTGATKEDE